MDGIDPESGDGMDLLSPSALMEMDGIIQSVDEHDGDVRHSSHRNSINMLDNESDVEDNNNDEDQRNKRHKSQRFTSSPVDAKVKIALSLYKVQQNIYLLDFQRVEVCNYL